jgi:hypothetical protein
MLYCLLQFADLLLLPFLGSVTPVHAVYYMDDTNSSIVYKGTSSKWSKVTSDIESWVKSPEIYFATVLPV